MSWRRSYWGSHDRLYGDVMHGIGSYQEKDGRMTESIVHTRCDALVDALFDWPIPCSGTSLVDNWTTLPPDREWIREWLLGNLNPKHYVRNVIQSLPPESMVCCGDSEGMVWNVGLRESHLFMPPSEPEWDALVWLAYCPKCQTMCCTIFEVESRRRWRWNEAQAKKRAKYTFPGVSETTGFPGFEDEKKLLGVS